MEFFMKKTKSFILSVSLLVTVSPIFAMQAQKDANAEKNKLANLINDFKNKPKIYSLTCSQGHTYTANSLDGLLYVGFISHIHNLEDNKLLNAYNKEHEFKIVAALHCPDCKTEIATQLPRCFSDVKTLFFNHYKKVHCDRIVYIKEKLNKADFYVQYLK